MTPWASRGTLDLDSAANLSASRSARQTVVVIVGTRPELVKMAGTIKALRQSETINVVVVFTGQHTELLDNATDMLNVHPDASILPLPTGRSLTGLLANIVAQLGELLEANHASCVVVQGDTVSALAGAVTSELMMIPLIHVEAGVRSRLRDDPFPEETIRRIISPITELHICFSEGTRENLILEGIGPDIIAVAPHPLRDHVQSRRLANSEIHPHVLATLHRRERRRQRSDLLIDLLTLHGLRHDCTFIWHPSLDGNLADLRHRLVDLNVCVVPPLPPHDFLDLLASSQLVITDSAGVAEEAQFLGRQLLVLRNSTETRIDGIADVPMCATETMDVASSFITQALSRPFAKIPIRTSSSTSSGQIIASHVELFVREYRRIVS